MTTDDLCQFGRDLVPETSGMEFGKISWIWESPGNSGLEHSKISGQFGRDLVPETSGMEFGKISWIWESPGNSGLEHSMISGQFGRDLVPETSGMEIGKISSNSNICSYCTLEFKYL